MTNYDFGLIGNCTSAARIANLIGNSRYVDDDGFGTPENAFIVCTFWMINALYLIGEEVKAREMFEAIRSCSNHLGLYAEDVEVESKRLTGNFPQGYSHLAFIQTAMLLETDYMWGDKVALLNAQAEFIN